MIADRLTKGMIDLQKSTFSMMLETMSTIQERSGRAAHAYFERMAGLPRQGVESWSHWMDSAQGARDEFRSMMRDGYDEWGKRLGRSVRHTEEARLQASPEISSNREMEQPPSENALKELKENIEEKRI